MYNSSLFQLPAAFDGTKNSLDEIALHFIYLMHLKSIRLYEHSVRVSNHAGAIAMRMKLPSSEVTLIRYAGLLHDIGLLMMPNSVLGKSPYLTTREMQLFKKHSDLGANMMETIPACQDMIPYIRFHHERWDGSGYPKHLKNVNIPLGARIVAVADYYDSNIHSASDFWGKTKSEAIRRIFSCSGILFDPEVIHAFVEVLDH